MSKHGYKLLILLLLVNIIIVNHVQRYDLFGGELEEVVHCNCIGGEPEFTLEGVSSNNHCATEPCPPSHPFAQRDGRCMGTGLFQSAWCNTEDHGQGLSTEVIDCADTLQIDKTACDSSGGPEYLIKHFYK